MQVELRQQVARHVITKEIVYPPQYEILVDGQLVGHLPHAPGSKPLLFRNLGPLELRELARIIRQKLHPQKIGDPVTPPEPPKGNEQSDDLNPFDSFDESESPV